MILVEGEGAHYWWLSVLDLLELWLFLSSTTIHKIFDTNSSFHVKYGKSFISVFQEFFASINKTFILAGGLGTGLLLLDLHHYLV